MDAFRCKKNLYLKLYNTCIIQNVLNYNKETSDLMNIKYKKACCTARWALYNYMLVNPHHKARAAPLPRIKHSSL